MWPACTKPQTGEGLRREFWGEHREGGCFGVACSPWCKLEQPLGTALIYSCLQLSTVGSSSAVSSTLSFLPYSREALRRSSTELLVSALSSFWLGENLPRLFVIPMCCWNSHWGILLEQFSWLTIHFQAEGTVLILWSDFHHSPGHGISPHDTFTLGRL